jgi:hypothetical protein
MYFLSDERQGIVQKMRIFIREVKDKVGIIFRIKQTLRGNHFYLGFC